MLMSWQLTDALVMPYKCFLIYIIVQFMCVHVCSCNTWGEPCLEHSPLVIRSCSKYLITNCLNGCFLKCLPPTAVARELQTSLGRSRETTFLKALTCSDEPPADTRLLFILLHSFLFPQSNVFCSRIVCFSCFSCPNL